MRHLISVKRNNELFCSVIIDSELSPDCTLYKFLFKHYASLMYEDVLSEEGDKEIFLKDRLDGQRIFYREGDEECDCYLGHISIKKVEPFYQDPEAITPQQFQAMVVNIWNEMTWENAEKRLRHMTEHAPQYANHRVGEGLYRKGMFTDYSCPR